MNALVLLLSVVCGIFPTVESTSCTIRDHNRYGGPCHYNASTGLILGTFQQPASGYVPGTGIYTGTLTKTYSGPMDQVTDWGPNGGYISSTSQYQLNVERNDNVFSYTKCDDLPYGSVEEHNFIQAHMDGNREDPDLYILHVDPQATFMHVCTPIYQQRCLTFASGFTQYDLTATSQGACNGIFILSPAMSVCHIEGGVQWTMTGYGLTELRGHVTVQNGQTTLHVQNAEYRNSGKFNQNEFSLPADLTTLEVTRTHVQFRQISNAFSAYYGTMYTEVLSYTANTTTVGVSTVFDVNLNTSQPCKLFCYGNTYWFNYTCVNHTMTNKTECMGGEFTYGTNLTDSICNPCIDSYDKDNICTPYSFTDASCVGGLFTPGTNMSDTTCVECQNSYEVNNVCVPYVNFFTNAGCVGGKYTPSSNITDSQCDPCPTYTRESDDGLSCTPWTYKNSSECIGGTFSNGTSTSDSVCYECLWGSYEIADENSCTSWSYFTVEDCLSISRRHIFHPGTNTSNSECIECPIGTMYRFENTCRDCNDLKNHFNSENCCRGVQQLELPYNLKTQPYRAVCQSIIDAWRYDCDQQCYV